MMMHNCTSSDHTLLLSAPLLLLQSLHSIGVLAVALAPLDVREVDVVHVLGRGRLRPVLLRQDPMLFFNVSTMPINSNTVWNRNHRNVPGVEARVLHRPMQLCRVKDATYAAGERMTSKYIHTTVRINT